LNFFGDYCICSVSERLWRYFAAMNLCCESGEGGCDFSNFLRDGRCVSVFSLWVFQALGVEESAGRGGEGWKWCNRVWSGLQVYLEMHLHMVCT
jgi:hypothetical protein